jgi:hypothetical protein
VCRPLLQTKRLAQQQVPCKSDNDVKTVLRFPASKLSL